MRSGTVCFCPNKPTAGLLVPPLPNVAEPTSGLTAILSTRLPTNALCPRSRAASVAALTWEFVRGAPLCPGLQITPAEVGLLILPLLRLPLLRLPLLRLPLLRLPFLRLPFLRLPFLRMSRGKCRPVADALDYRLLQRPGGQPAVAVQGGHLKPQPGTHRQKGEKPSHGKAVRGHEGGEEIQILVHCVRDRLDRRELSAVLGRGGCHSGGLHLQRHR